MLCYKMLLRGRKGVQSLNYQNASIELKLDQKCACDILTMIKHYAMF